MKHIMLFGNYHSRFLSGLVGILVVFFTSALDAQITSIKLPTADSSSGFRVLNNSNATLLRLNGDAGFYLGGTYGTGNIPKTGAGTRLMWHPRRSAFRAGYVSGTQWDDENTGSMSAAFGYNTTATGSYSIVSGYGSTSSGNQSAAFGQFATASGSNSFAAGQLTTSSNDNATAMGYRTTASGENSTAMGYWTNASGGVSTAVGDSTAASGYASTAMGFRTTASGDYSTAMGISTFASGWASTAMGYMTTSSAIYSTAMGDNTTASGVRSTAMGSYVSTNSKGGAFIIGDNSTNVVSNSSANNEMMMRFDGGYKLYSNSLCTTGVALSAGGSSWSSTSDARRKENYAKADGECFLNSLARLNLGSWNYIGQDVKTFRHYGPMAQEIFRYFGNDGVGIIGNDTTLASADMDGIMMICLQALEKRTSELRKANEKIAKLENCLLQQKLDQAQQKAEQAKVNSILAERIEKLTQLYSSLTSMNQSQLTTHLTKEE